MIVFRFVCFYVFDKKIEIKPPHYNYDNYNNDYWHDLQ